MEINGKVYRNLEGQVGYLTDKYDDLQNQINDVRAHLTHYVEVDTLPTGDDIDPSAVYLLGPMGTAPDQYYEEWVYVQKADESWVWEKLGDTDSVDLSGYLPIQDGVTTLPQVYAKNESGEQVMVNMDIAATALTIPFRDANGRMKVAAPDADGDAANKKYVDDNFVAKQTGTTSYRQAYVKNADGTQTMVEINPVGVDAAQGRLALYYTSGRLRVGEPSNGSDATSKQYVENNFLAKQTGTTSVNQVYTKAPDGSQVMWNISTSASGAIIVRKSDGQVHVPTTPSDNNDAASKAYVDDAVGQLLYLHDIELVITVDASNKLYVKAYLVSGSATAITSFDRQLYRRIDVQWGAFGPDMANVEAVAVSKLPDTFRQDEFDEPFVGFLYQYISGGNLISGKTDSNMSTTITDVVVSF